MGSYVPTTAAEREEMLAAIGVKSLEDLYQAVPQGMLLNGTLNIPEGMSELEVREAVTAMAEKNKVYKTVLRGAGAYRHFIPAVVKSITSREELVTCYTPYQAEISQGVLQGTFEFQTMICELTGMDVANASHYDGATAAAETIPMCRDRKRTKAYVSACVNPQVIEVMQTYCFASNTELTVVPAKDGRTDLDALKAALGEDAACFYLQQPNYFGQIEDARAIGELIHAAGAKFVMGVNPIACAILPTPRRHDAQAARPHRRSDEGRRRQDRLCAHALRAGAAHPPREGQLQHLLESGAVRLHRGRLHGGDGRSGHEAVRTALHFKGALLCRRACQGRLQAQVSGRILPRVRDRG